MGAKKIHIEFLRILAIYLVMFNHTQNGGFLYFAQNSGDPWNVLYMTASVFCKIAVPVFFMITGALLLKKNESVKTLITKRVLKFVFVLAFISLFYYMLLCDDHSPVDFLKRLYTSNLTTGLWYLYSYIGVLLMLPILRKCAQALGQKEYMYLFVCHVILVGIIPISEYLLWQGRITLNGDLSAVMFTANNVFFVLLGHYCENVLDIEKITRKKLLIMGAASAMAIAITCVATFTVMKNMGVADSASLQQFFFSLISLPSFTVYVMLRKICAKGVPKAVERVGVAIGGSVFGAYLFEKWIRMLTGFVYGGLKPIIGSFWASVLWVGVGMTAGLLLITLIKKIPFVGKYVDKII